MQWRVKMLLREANYALVDKNTGEIIEKGDKKALVKKNKGMDGKYTLSFTLRKVGDKVKV